MKPALLVPAAGSGTRLGGALPKVLAPVLGRPMLDHLLDLHAPFVSRVLLVVRPAFADAVAEHCAGRSPEVELALQQEPTGMLDAVAIGARALRGRRPTRVWVTWCDQVAVSPATLARLAARDAAVPEADLVLPTLRRAAPYVHLERDAAGRIAAVRHRREGDAMPPEGEGDMGLFSLSASACFEALPQFAAAAPRGARTGERNFLELLPWLAARGRVETLPGAHEIETVGINTPEDLARVEAHLRSA